MVCPECNRTEIRKNMRWRDSDQPRVRLECRNCMAVWINVYADIKVTIADERRRISEAVETKIKTLDNEFACEEEWHKIEAFDEVLDLLEKE